jgi:hypothetical protein
LQVVGFLHVLLFLNDCNRLAIIIEVEVGL